LTVCGTASETTIYTVSIPGGSLGTNKKLAVVLDMDRLKNGGGTDAATLRVKYGGGTIDTLQVPQVTVDSATHGSGMLLCDLQAAGATNSQQINCMLSMTQTPNGTTSSGLSAEYGTAAVDSTSAQTFLVSYQWSTAGTSAQHCLTSNFASIQQISP
jgi:hypothetical protein